MKGRLLSTKRRSQVSIIMVVAGLRASIRPRHSSLSSLLVVQTTTTGPWQVASTTLVVCSLSTIYYSRAVTTVGAMTRSIFLMSVHLLGCVLLPDCDSMVARSMYLSSFLLFCVSRQRHLGMTYRGKSWD